MTRIEAYSCKSVASERKMIKSLDQEFTSDLEVAHSVSPPRLIPGVLDSVFGRMDRKDSRMTFWLLIATLNLAYPDHDFSKVKVENFGREDSPREVLVKMSEALETDGSSANNNFTSSLGALSISPKSFAERASDAPRLPPADTLAGVHPMIRQILDPIIDLSQCEVYSYCPDPDSDPHSVESDDEDGSESVASSIFGGTKVDHLLPSHELTDNTMWEMEAVDASTYLEHSAPASVMHLRQSHLNLPPDTDVPNNEGPEAVLAARTDKRPPSICQVSSPDDQQAASGHPPSARHKMTVFANPGPSSPMVELEEESAGGLLWSSHHFFFNKKMKRILFISSWGRKITGHSNNHGHNTSYFSNFNSNFTVPPLSSTHRVDSDSHNKTDTSQDSSEHKRRLSSSNTKLIQTRVKAKESDERCSQSKTRPRKKIRATQITD